MAYLIDTQVLIWLFSQPDQLSETAKKIITNRENQLFVSAASFWEIAIKISIGKLKLPFDLSKLIEETAAAEIEILDIEISHIFLVATLPFHHRDPFDRLLVSQAITENMPLLSKDEILPAYPIQVIW